MLTARCTLLAVATALPTAAWRSVSVDDYGAVGDNRTDNTAAFRAALAAVAVGGGEVLVPAGKAYQTGPFNMTSDVNLRVDGAVVGIANKDAFPVIGVLPSYGHDLDTDGHARRHPLVYAVGARNVTVSGRGVIDGAG
eukprot:gene11887-10275_t